MWGNEISFHLSRPRAKYSPWQTKWNVKVNSPEVSATISRRDGACGFQGLQRWFQPQIVRLLSESVSRLLYWWTNHLSVWWLTSETFEAQCQVYWEILLNRIYNHLSPFHINEMPEFWVGYRSTTQQMKSLFPIIAPDSHSEAILSERHNAPSSGCVCLTPTFIKCGRSPQQVCCFSADICEAAGCLCSFFSQTSDNIGWSWLAAAHPPCYDCVVGLLGSTVTYAI